MVKRPMNRLESTICLIVLILAMLTALLLPALIEPTGPLHTLLATATGIAACPGGQARERQLGPISTPCPSCLPNTPCPALP